MTKYQIFSLGLALGLIIGVVLMAALEIGWPILRKIGGKNNGN